MEGILEETCLNTPETIRDGKEPFVSDITNALKIVDHIEYKAKGVIITIQVLAKVTVTTTSEGVLEYISTANLAEDLENWGKEKR